jgi:hypothetical protein
LSNKIPPSRNAIVYLRSAFVLAKKKLETTEFVHLPIPPPPTNKEEKVLKLKPHKNKPAPAKY